MTLFVKADPFQMTSEKPPITYTPGFISNSIDALGILHRELSWERRGSTPRSEYYVNRLGPIPYTYGVGAGKREYLPKPTHPLIEEIFATLLRETKVSFDVCFLNRYHNQSDHLGWHADDSPEMDDLRPIAIISLTFRGYAK
jgi:alkylated DNA repair dioxygenase AlkB